MLPLGSRGCFVHVLPVTDSPPEIISVTVVWLSTTPFPLSYRETLEKMMFYRGIEVTYESIRRMVLRTAVCQSASAPYIADKMAFRRQWSRLKGSNIICGERWMRREGTDILDATTSGY